MVVKDLIEALTTMEQSLPVRILDDGEEMVFDVERVQYVARTGFTQIVLGKAV